MASHQELSTNWERSAGNFQCLNCGHKRLPAAAFGKNQLIKAQKHPDLAATCKACTQAAEAAGQKAAVEKGNSGQAPNSASPGSVQLESHKCSACKVLLCAPSK